MLQLIHDVLHALDHACPAVEERTARLTLPPAADGILPTYALGRKTSLVTAWRIPCRRSRSMSRVNPRHTCATSGSTFVIASNQWRNYQPPFWRKPTAYKPTPRKKNQQAAGV